MQQPDLKWEQCCCFFKVNKFSVINLNSFAQRLQDWQEQTPDWYPNQNYRLSHWRCCELRNRKQLAPLHSPYIVNRIIPRKFSYSHHPRTYVFLCVALFKPLDLHVYTAGKKRLFTWNQRILPANFHIIRNIFFSLKPRAFPPPRLPPDEQHPGRILFLSSNTKFHRAPWSSRIIATRGTRKGEGPVTVAGKDRIGTSFPVTPLKPPAADKTTDNKQDNTLGWSKSGMLQRLPVLKCLPHFFFSFFFVLLTPTTKQTYKQTNKQTKLPQPCEWLLAFIVFLSSLSFLFFFLLLFLPLTHHSNTHQCCVTSPLFDEPVLKRGGGWGRVRGGSWCQGVRRY